MGDDNRFLLSSHSIIYSFHTLPPTMPRPQHPPQSSTIPSFPPPPSFPLPPPLPPSFSSKHPLLVTEMLRKVRELENQMFGESMEIFHILNEEQPMRVDGLTYQQIQSSPQFSATLQQIRSNIPLYQHLSKRKKSAFMKRLGRNYEQKLATLSEQQRILNQAEEEDTQNINSKMVNQPESKHSKCSRSARSKMIKKRNGKVQKLETIQEEGKGIVYRKRSSCKYFDVSKSVASLKNSKEQQFQTFSLP